MSKISVQMELMTLKARYRAEMEFQNKQSSVERLYQKADMMQNQIKQLENILKRM